MSAQKIKAKSIISPFTARVYAYCSLIPPATVSTYRDLARAIGHPRAYRAVGQALHANPFAPKVPCHRVISAGGRLGGYAFGASAKARRLREEGVVVTKNRIDLEKFRKHWTKNELANSEKQGQTEKFSHKKGALDAPQK